MNWYIEVVNFCSRYSALPALWLGRKQRGFLWYYALASFLADLLSAEFMLDFFPILNSISGLIINLFFLLQLSLLGLYLINQLTNRSLKIVCKIIIIALAAFFIYKTGGRFIRSIFWNEQVFGHIFLMTLCLLTLMTVFRNIEHIKIERSPAFLFAACFLLLEAYSVLLFLFTEQFMNASKTLIQNVWSVHNLLNILTNLVIARIFILQEKAKSSPKNKE
ncbi:MAG: hypothetical protein JST06_00295 [Bacteroidetes bacterium]|nr:hypothetical protein [Bacteroidota bacterium]MBS1629953.1 hypothetical protein [Bacteroidota bacterium]